MNPRPLVAILALWIFVGACSSNVPPRPSATPPTSSGAASGPTGPTAPASPEPGSAEAARERLCRQPPLPPPSRGPAEGPTPRAIAQVEEAVEKIRALHYEEPVVPDAVTHEVLARRLRRSFERSFPVGLYRRRSLAWQTIGVIPDGTSIRGALERFFSTQVIGYYDASTGQLVFIGTKHPSPTEQVTLAHELTHALDDQHYDLTRLDRLSAACRDEQATAALALIEGDATYVMLQYARTDLTPEQQVQVALGAGSGPSTAGIPPFIVAEEQWPYSAGLAFISSLVARGGEASVDRAFERFPVSSEQILHPSAYPSDPPVAVNVGDLGRKLGVGWKDLDVQDVGEEWLSNMLKLRIDASTATVAAAGWGGRIYRAWVDQAGHVAVVLSTVWDTSGDASEFAAAMTDWISGGSGQAAEVEPVTGSRVTVLFASDARTLGRLRSAL